MLLNGNIMKMNSNFVYFGSRLIELNLYIFYYKGINTKTKGVVNNNFHKIIELNKQQQ